jgi:cell division protein FtsN
MVPLGQPSGVGTSQTDVRVATQTVRVPEGYKLAWEDDRLNPLRGVGTAEGQAMQDQVWTRKVPAEAVADAPKRRVVLSSQSAPAVVVSTKLAPVAAQGGRIFVQVGSFGQPANADGASARLAALGLPVARSKGQIGGKAVQVVLAGPFGSAAEAQAALQAARGAGFGDAFVR